MSSGLDGDLESATAVHLVEGLLEVLELEDIGDLRRKERSILSSPDNLETEDAPCP